MKIPVAQFNKEGVKDKSPKREKYVCGEGQSVRMQINFIFMKKK